MRVFVFFVFGTVELIMSELAFEFLPQFLRILNLCDSVEVFCVWNAKRLHAKRVFRFGKMSLKISPPPIRLVATYFAWIKMVQSVQFE
mmetsp:Transcript_43420/g.120732  ORF Transcript_43420/g.120732 Transcript_43420/m.120732 type:complete len:88 (-) Transcript_43420:142-405(-)